MAKTKCPLIDELTLTDDDKFFLLRQLPRPLGRFSLLEKTKIGQDKILDQGLPSKIFNELCMEGYIETQIVLESSVRLYGENDNVPNPADFMDSVNTVRLYGKNDNVPNARPEFKSVKLLHISREDCRAAIEEKLFGFSVDDVHWKYNDYDKRWSFECEVVKTNSIKVQAKKESSSHPITKSSESREFKRFFVIKNSKRSPKNENADDFEDLGAFLRQWDYDKLISVESETKCRGEKAFVIVVQAFCAGYRLTEKGKIFVSDYKLAAQMKVVANKKQSDEQQGSHETSIYSLEKLKDKIASCPTEEQRKKGVKRSTINDRNEVWISVEEAAEKIGVNKRQLSRYKRFVETIQHMGYNLGIDTEGHVFFMVPKVWVYYYDETIDPKSKGAKKFLNSILKDI